MGAENPGSLLGLPGSRRGSQCRRASSEMRPQFGDSWCRSHLDAGCGSRRLGWAGGGWGWAGLVGGLGWEKRFSNACPHTPEAGLGGSPRPDPASSLKFGFRVR